MDTHAHLADDATEADDILLPLPSALHVIGLSRSKVYEILASGELPQPVKIGARNYFSRRELQAWISERLGERGEGSWR